MVVGYHVVPLPRGVGMPSRVRSTATWFMLTPRARLSKMRMTILASAHTIWYHPREAWSCNGLCSTCLGATPARQTDDVGRAGAPWRRRHLQRQDAVAQDLLHGPDMVGQAGGHGRSAFLPFVSAADGPPPQALVGPAGIVDRSDQPHATAEHRRAVGPAAATPGQGGPRGAAR